MANPFKYISQQFSDEFDVCFIIERMDDGLTVLLSDESGVMARRRIASEQLSDRIKLDQVVQSIRFGLAIDQGKGFDCLDQMSHRQVLRQLGR